MNPERTQVMRVRTPEGVAFTFRIASPVLRAGALIIDLAAISTAFSILAVPLSLLQLFSLDAAGLVLTVAYFLISQGYSVACEAWLNGQTLGKRLLRLRVVDASGLRLTFSQVLMRNLLRFVDALPAFYLVGAMSAFVNKRGQRLGDLVAGTVVIWEPAEVTPNYASFRNEKYNSLRAHAPAVARLRQTISPSEARAAWSALARRDQLDADARVILFGELASYFRNVAQAPADVTEGLADEHFVRDVIDVLYLNR